MTTNHKRWAVRIHQSHRNGSKCPKNRWVVDPPGFDYKKRAEHTGNWHRAGGNWFQWDRQRTKREAWKEALAYADKMARTVEVELPRDNTTVPLPEAFEKEAKPITLRRWAGETVIECTAQGVEEVIFVHDSELKPLALALLAHHYRNKP